MILRRKLLGVRIFTAAFELPTLVGLVHAVIVILEKCVAGVRVAYWLKVVILQGRTLFRVLIKLVA